MVVPVINDPIVAAVAAVVALLDIQKVVNAKSSEWLLYIVSLVFAILLFCFETIPMNKFLALVIGSSISDAFSEAIERKAITCTLASVNWIRRASSSLKNTSG